MYYLVYISKAVKLQSNDDLTALLNQSRTYNKIHNITGILLYMEDGLIINTAGRFMQVLEGERQVVESLYEKIKSDYRHHHIIILNEEVIDVRNFPDWTMGFQSLTHTHTHTQLKMRGTST